MDTEGNVRRYWAFISYSHSDKSWADWLHKSLENYPMPRDLVGKPSPADAPIPKRFIPVFRDREELPTATDLGAIIAKALRHARFLVVICSPRSAKSQWVEQEIVHYKRLHGEDRVLCLIVDGEPWASDCKPGFTADDECFPRAVRYRLSAAGEVSDERTEPIAADAREGKDGKENAVIKLMAGLLGVGFDDLRRREQAYQRQRVRRFQMLAATFGVLLLAAITAACYALVQKKAVQRTLSQSDLQLSVQARDEYDVSRSAAYLARSLKSDPDNLSAAMAAFSLLAHHQQHPPVGPVLRHPGEVKAAFGSIDGKTIVSASGDIIYLWSRPDNKLLSQSPVDGSVVMALAPIPSGAGIVAGTAKGAVHFLGLADLKPQREPLATGTPGVLVLAWNPAGDVLAVGLAENSDPKKSGGWIMLVSAEGKEISRVKLDNVTPLTLAWSRDGRQVAAAGDSPFFYHLSLDDSKPRLKELKSDLVVTGLSFDALGKLRVMDLYTGLKDWDLATGEASEYPITISRVASKTAFSPDGSMFLGMRRGPSAMIYNARTGEVPTEPISPGFTVSNGIWLDVNHVLLTSENGFAQVRQIRPPLPVATVGHFRHSFPDVSTLTSDGGILAAANSADPLVRFYDTRTLKEISRPLRFPSGLHGMGFLPDGKTLGALCFDGKFHRVEWRKALKFEVGTEALIPKVEGSFSQNDRVRFNPQGTLMAVPQGRSVLMIDVSQGKIRNLIDLAEEVTAVAWSPDGTALAAATKGQSLIYFRPDGSTMGNLQSPKLNSPTVHLEWAPDGQCIAALTNSDRVDFYNPTTGRPASVSLSTGPCLEPMAWVSNGKWLVTFTTENEMKLWDVKTGVPIAILPKLHGPTMRAYDMNSRNEILAITEKGLALIPLAKMSIPPAWVPNFLEAMGGARLNEGEDAQLFDPDAWLAKEAAPSSDSGDSVWAPLHQWLLSDEPGRPVAVGAQMREPEAQQLSALLDSDQTFSVMLKKIDRLWKSEKESDLMEALGLWDEALLIDPDFTQLEMRRLRWRQYSPKPLLIRDSNLAIAAAKDSTLIEVLTAKTGAAKAILQIEPMDKGAARKLLHEVLAEDPDNLTAKGVLETILR